MKVLFIHQYFRTPEEGGGIRSYYMCKALIEKGHEVVLITAHNEKESLFKEIDGIKVYYLPVFYENRLGFLGRSYAFIKFLILATTKALKFSDTDKLYISSSPLTVGIIGMITKKIRKKPFIFEVMDLWPEAPIQMGFIKNPLLKWMLYRLEKMIYESAELVIAASPGMEEGIKKAAPECKTVMIPNMSDCIFFYPSPKKPELLKKYNVVGKFVCCYTGAIGLSNKLEDILRIASYLKQRNVIDVQFLIAGEGADLKRLKFLADEYELNNISFLGYLSKMEIRDIYNISDLNLIFFSEEKILETNSPNKFFDGLASGIPAVINIKGWIKEICEESRCGKFFNRNSPEEFLNIIQEFRTNPEAFNEYKQNSRKVAERKFNKIFLLNTFLAVFEKPHSLNTPKNPRHSQV